MDINPILRASSKLLAKYLTRTVSSYRPFSVQRTETLVKLMQPGDILLVEGDQRVSSAIKYLTQSTWSHAAFYVGDHPRLSGPTHRANNNSGGKFSKSSDADDSDAEEHTEHSSHNFLLIEADLENGVISVPLSKYCKYNIRICRPLNLSDTDRKVLCDYMIDSIGMEYDLKNITDLARYLLPNPPVPARWRRRMLALGSGDPTRAICSSLIAQAFQLIKYPILPDRECRELKGRAAREYLHIRHHSLFAPRDFDISPYFQIIKPELQHDFDYTSILWDQHTDDFLESGERSTPS